MIASRFTRVRQHLLWIAAAPFVEWFNRKPAESSSQKQNSQNDNTLNSYKTNNPSNDETYFYPSREIIDRIFGDIQEYHNQHNKQPDNDNNDDNSDSIRAKVREAFHTIIYPFTELDGLRHSQQDNCIESATFALSQEKFDPIFYRPALNVDKLIIQKDNTLHEYKLEELMTNLLEKVLEIDRNVTDCARLLSEQTLLLLAEGEHFYDIFFHADYNRHFRDSNRLRRYLKLYLEAILENLYSDKERTLCLLENGLLVLLHRLRKDYPEKDVFKWISMCISALSVYEEAHEHLFDTGWIGILAEWLHSDDSRIHLEARRALYNIVNMPQNRILQRSLFLLHDSEQPEFDIVFIHGLRGGVLRTWRQLDSIKIDQNSTSYTECWPKSWLAQDFPNSRIIAVNYQTFLSNWNISCGSDSYTLKGRSDKLYEDLKLAGLGRRPIIWVVHSMGGLLLKQMLTDEAFYADEYFLEDACFVENTSGIVFFSVPNKGSEMAVWSPNMQRIIAPSDHVMELRKDSPELHTLHQKFVNLYRHYDFELLSFGETQECCVLQNPFKYYTLLVDEDSANPGIGKFELLNENHFNICKPKSKDSQAYVGLKQFICDIVGGNSVEKQLKKEIFLSTVV